MEQLKVKELVNSIRSPSSRCTIKKAPLWQAVLTFNHLNLVSIFMLLVLIF